MASGPPFTGFAWRHVEPERLDALDAHDAHARRARRDLRRINRLMGTLAIALRALDDAACGAPPRKLLELGAGDGSLMLRIARRRAHRWPGLAVTLLDRQAEVPAKTLDALHRLGWPVDLVRMDALEWLAVRPPAHRDLVFANLFVHHFDGEAFTALLRGIAACTRAFVCCEPRRSAPALAASRMVGLIGAGAVTRHDAVASVRAGFCGEEISRAWPGAGEWRLREYDCAFTHCFSARRAAS